MKNLKLSNFKELKTTFLGLIFLAVAFFGVWKYESFNIWIFIILIGVGILMLFAPNKFISSLVKFVSRNADTKIKEDDNS